MTSLLPLMAQTKGNPAIRIGLLDGPVFVQHPELSGQDIQELGGSATSGCSRVGSSACVHGTLVAGVLVARRGASSPAICPSCTLLVRSIFDESIGMGTELPSATPSELAA